MLAVVPATAGMISRTDPVINDESVQNDFPPNNGNATGAWQHWA